MADIRLRGHHLEILRKFIRYGEENYLNNICLEYFHECNVELYSQEFYKKIISLCNKIIKNPELEIQIVDSLDDICGFDCPRISKTCDSRYGASYDSDKASNYDLKIGETYVAKDIVIRLIKAEIKYLDFIRDLMSQNK